MSRLKPWNDLFHPAPDRKKVTCRLCGRRVVIMKNGQIFNHHGIEDRKQWSKTTWCPAGLTQHKEIENG